MSLQHPDFSNMTPSDAIAFAIDKAGGQTALANQINEYMDTHPLLKVDRKPTNQKDVGRWLHRDQKASATYSAIISEITGIPTFVLRPDVFTRPLKTA